MNRTSVIVTVILAALSLLAIAVMLSANRIGALLHNAQGMTYLRQRHYTLAEDAFSQAIRGNPSNAIYYNNRGLAEYHLQQFTQARRDLGQAIGLNPRLALAYGNRGQLCKAEGDYAQALQDFTTCVTLKPNALHYVFRSGIYIRLRQYDNAIADCTSALQYNSKDAIAYNNRGYAQYFLQHYSEALADLNESIRLDPAHAQGPCRNRLLVYHAMGQQPPPDTAQPPAPSNF